MFPIRRIAHSVIRGLGVAIAIVLFAIGPTALGQETHGLTPDTMTSEWFNTEITRLGLEYDQRIALEAAHERYKTAWRRFRDTDLRALAEAMEEVQGSGMQMPDRELVEKIVKRGRSVTSKIEQMERMLFEELEPYLHEQQAVHFERFRNLRERARYETEVIGGPFGGANIVNLTRLVDQLELSPTEEATIEDALHQYEVSINSAMKSLYSSTMSMILDMFEVMEEMGIGENIDETDEAGMMRVQMAMMQAMKKAAEDRQEASAHAQQVNTSSYARLKGLLGPDVAGRLEDLFKKATYPNVFNDHSSPEQLIEKALASDEVTGSQRGEIRDVATQWRSKYASYNSRMVKLTDQTREAEEQMMFGANEEHMKAWEELHKSQQERQELHTRTTTRIREILGEEVANTLAAQSYDSIAIGMDLSVSGAMVQAQMLENVVWTENGQVLLSLRSRGWDTALPGAISSDELDFYLNRLGFDPDLKVIAHEFLADYSAAFTSLHEKRYNNVVGSAQQRIWQEGEINTDAIQDYADGRRQMLQAILKVENDLFDQLGSLIDPAKRNRLAAVRQARLCAVYDLGDVVFNQMGRTNVDYYQIVMGLGLSAEEMVQLNPVFESYESDALPVLQEQHRTFIDHEAAQSRAQSLWQTQDGTQVDQQRIWEEYEALTGPTEQAKVKLAAERDNLEQQLVADLRSSLPGRVMSSFEDQYNRKTYPQVYPDRADAAPTFELAMQLTELADGQRTQIESLWGTHLVEHGAYCDELMQLTDLTKVQPDFSNMDPQEMMEFSRAQSRLASTQLDRLEFNETSRRALRAVLREEQAAQIRGLDVEVKQE